jgi:putative nucleotidyltransferase with HDIG domain
VIGPESYERDPLRPLRLARFAAELGFTPDPETERLTAAAAARVPEASGERLFAELRRLVLAEHAVPGLALADRLGLLGAVLPELADLHDVDQSHFHHKDVYGHTLEVLERLVELEGEATGELREVLDEPLADELTRGEALRFGALLHDIGKPATYSVREDGRVTFTGHDRLGEDMVRDICRRLRTSDRLSRFLEGLTRHHLVLGFLVHARELMPAALEWRRHGPPRLPLRGDELAREAGIEPGPELGRVLAELQEAAYAGEIESREETVDLARRLRQNLVQ